MTETFNAVLSNEVESQGRISFGGIWQNASWAHDLDLYDDYEYEKYDDDIIIESEDPKEGDEEDPNEENLRGEDSNNDSKEGSSTGSNINS